MRPPELLPLLLLELLLELLLDELEDELLLVPVLLVDELEDEELLLELLEDDDVPLLLLELLLDDELLLELELLVDPATLMATHWPFLQVSPVGQSSSTPHASELPVVPWPASVGVGTVLPLQAASVSAPAERTKAVMRMGNPVERPWTQLIAAEAGSPIFGTLREEFRASAPGRP